VPALSRRGGYGLPWRVRCRGSFGRSCEGLRGIILSSESGVYSATRWVSPGAALAFAYKTETQPKHGSSADQESPGAKLGLLFNMGGLCCGHYCLGARSAQV